MELKQILRTGPMDDAHNDELVIGAAGAFLEVGSNSMVALLKESLYGNHYPGPRALSAVVNLAGLPNEHHDPAYRMAEAAMRIGAQTDALRTFRFGAVLEKIVSGLLGQRSVRVFEEIAVAPMPAFWGFTWSEPIDHVVDDPSIEFLECKCSATDIEGVHLKKFAVVYDLAQEDDRDPRMAFVTLSRASTTAELVASLLQVDRPIFAATLEDLAELAVQKAKLQVA